MKEGGRCYKGQLHAIEIIEDDPEGKSIVYNKCLLDLVKVGFQGNSAGHIFSALFTTDWFKVYVTHTNLTGIDVSFK